MKSDSYFKSVVLIVLLIGLIFLVGCNNDEQAAKESDFRSGVKTDNFYLFVEGPEQIKTGKEFSLKGTLEYIGEDEIKLKHDKPIIRFAILDEDSQIIEGKKAFTTELPLSQIKLLNPGDKLEVKETMKLNKSGDFEVRAKTTTLQEKSDEIERLESSVGVRSIKITANGCTEDNNTKIQELPLKYDDNLEKAIDEQSLTYKHVENVFEEKGLNLDEKESLECPLDIDLPISPKSYKAGEQNDPFFIYQFDSVYERKEYFPMDYRVVMSDMDYFSEIRDDNTMLGSSNNIVLAYYVVDPNEHPEKTREATDIFMDTLFYELHDINEVVYRGQGDYWDVEFEFEFYDYEWMDDDGEEHLEFFGYYDVEVEYLGDNPSEITELDYSYYLRELFDTEGSISTGGSSRESEEGVLDEDKTYSSRARIREPIGKEEVEFSIEWSGGEEEFVVSKQSKNNE
ncbi:hypothetical protein [Natranaerofaba carboxydovora]|uniref:hypothetical protein n=1 Tax=Natranaerofaba carboxydovora TaxID=2742683 RepID=UPI001F13B3C0|nr:hypothetical protein [Natranaerofaba carboxydovora]UMZ74399.1 hypothetical protein ACONDI_01987 [Natranaerofaba carboxydovora]